MSSATLRSETAARRPSPRLATTSAAKGRLMVADDDLEMRHLLAWAFRREGFDVEEATNGIDLLDRVAASTRENEPLDLVITDIRMPGITGLEALDWLQEVGCRVPVIVITAFGDRSAHECAERLGAWAVLDKPFDFEALHTLVWEWFESRSRRAAEGPRPRRSGSSHTPTPGR